MCGSLSSRSVRLFVPSTLITWRDGRHGSEPGSDLTCPHQHRLDSQEPRLRLRLARPPHRAGDTTHKGDWMNDIFREVWLRALPHSTATWVGHRAERGSVVWNRDGKQVSPPVLLLRGWAWLPGTKARVSAQGWAPRDAVWH